ncbi:hypothetical protein LJC61_03305 [Ruminococcaceae bacterium OttesenSCG-928-A16]|nr:hypothetical protein [Ruminococcaceae bacterium OttesenSCG-928-A16]
MKKRILSVALAFALILCMGAMHVFAASPQGGVAIDETGSVTPAGTKLAYTVMNDAATVNFMEAKRQELGVAGSLMAVYDINLVNADTYAPVTPDGDVMVRVNISGLASYDTVTVLHEKADGTVEKIAATANNGYATFTTSSFSLFGFCVEKGQAPAEGGGTTATSPQTGVYR